MKIVFLDTKTISDDISLKKFENFGEFITYDTTNQKEITSEIKNTNIVITNKVVINKNIMDNALELKIICIAATETNNIDLKYAKQIEIVVKNIANYSTNSVVQHTFSPLFYMEKLGQAQR